MLLLFNKSYSFCLSDACCVIRTIQRAQGFVTISIKAARRRFRQSSSHDQQTQTTSQATSDVTVRGQTM